MGAETGRRQAAWVLVVTGAATLAAAEAGLFAGIELVESWFYNLAWWSYILLADGIVHLRTGSSLILSRPRAFFLLLPWSAAFWLVFEAANFVLDNWYYVNLPPGAVHRYAGVVIAFATVLPGIFETTDLLRSFGLFRGARCRPLPLTPGLLRALSLLGVACLLLPLAIPRFGFPLVWLAVFLLLEPWLARRRAPGLLTRLSRGELRPVLLLLAGGLGAGLLWEFWNFWARAKWIYTVPFFEEAKLFEMPVLGFLGFPPFALECYAFTRLLACLGLVPEWERSAAGEGPPLLAGEPVQVPAGTAGPARPRLQATGLAAAVAFAVPVLVGVNRLTVRSTLPIVAEIPGMPPAEAARLEQEGLRWAGDLLEWERPAWVLESDWERWTRRAELLGVRGLGLRGALWLERTGVRSREQLAAADADRLLEEMSGNGVGLPRPVPTPAEVRVWISGARRVQGHSAPSRAGQ